MKLIELDICGIQHLYELNGVLGRGTKCIVYSAFDWNSCKPCIVKELYPQILQSQGVLRRNGNEIICDPSKISEWLSAMSVFKNGFKVFTDYLKRNKHCFCESITYSNIISAYGSLYSVSYEIASEWNPSLNDIPKLIDEFIDVCVCIGHMHRDMKQILAMDIKTSNFVISNGKVKLTDFDGLVPKNNICQTSNLIYTSLTASPEVLDHRYRDICPASDVYSIMLMLAQVITNDKKVRNNLSVIKNSLTKLNLAADVNEKIFEIFTE